MNGNILRVTEEAALGTSPLGRVEATSNHEGTKNSQTEATIDSKAKYEDPAANKHQDPGGE